MPDFAVRWKNFRAFADSNWLEFNPLTILIGANNTGKTSVFVPLLLLKQTLESDDAEIRLKPGGPYFNAGLYSDLIYKHKRGLTLSLSLRWLQQKPPKPGDLGPIGQYPPGTHTLDFSYIPKTKDIVLTRYELTDIFKRTLVRRRRLRTGRYSLGGVRYPPGTTKVANATRKLIRLSAPKRFLFEAGDILRDIITSQETLSVSKNVKGETETRDIRVELPKELAIYLRSVDTGDGIVRQLLDSIIYVGPLREPPKRIYEISAEKPSDVGVKGQHAPEILFHNTDRTFRQDVNTWINRFEFGEKIQTTEMMDGFFTLEITQKNGGFITNFADMGFGLSQVFPLVIEGLSATRGSCLILEQPEIHLNPRLQARLADLIGEVVKRGVSVIVESHSEHVLLRLRRMVAENKIKADDVSLYYVEKYKDESQIRNIPIEGNGHIKPEKWPKGFFEDSFKEALGLAHSQIERRDRAE